MFESAHSGCLMRCGDASRDEGGELKSDVIILNDSVSSCEKGEVWRCAFRLLDDMREREVMADVISFDSAVISCKK